MNGEPNDDYENDENEEVEGGFVDRGYDAVRMVIDLEKGGAETLANLTSRFVAR